MPETRFTGSQYEQAVSALLLAKKQLQADGNNCSVCGDSGHMAYECGHNPLVAVAMCREIAAQSESLHQSLHVLGGWEQAFGVQLGPARIIEQPDVPIGDDDA